jgi:hypothetical protein
VTTVPPNPPRTARLTERLNQQASTVRAEAETQLDAAVTASGRAFGEQERAVRALTEASSAVAEAGASVFVAGGHAVAGTGLAAAGAIIHAGERVSDLVGAALQRLGRGLIDVGNFLRSIDGGGQVVVHDLERGDKGASLSERLFARSREHFGLAASSFREAIDALVSAGGDLAVAADALLGVAVYLTEVAARGGAVLALEVTAAALEAARVAVQAVEHGLDTAGALLQSAGRAIIAAGNAVSAPSGTTTQIDRAP